MASIKSVLRNWPWASIPNNRKLETALTRLRLGHCGLNAHLYRFVLHHTPFCECGVPETVLHCFVDCERYRRPRLNLRAILGRHKLIFNLGNLLGGRWSCMRRWCATEYSGWGNSISHSGGKAGTDLRMTIDGNCLSVFYTYQVHILL